MSETRICKWCREIVYEGLCGCAAENMERELEATESQLAAANKRADHYQAQCAQLSDKYAGTPCTEIRHQQEKCELDAELMRLKNELISANKRADLAQDDRDRVFAEFDLLRERHRKVTDAIKEAMENG